MLKRIVAVAGLLVLAGSVPAFAQDSKVEVSATIGWAFSDGVSADTPVLAPDGNIYDRVDPKDSFLWGLTGGVNVTENAEVGFMWTQQMSSLLLGGTNERDLGDMTVSTYHGYFAYNFFPSDSTVRPFLLIGLGVLGIGGSSTGESADLAMFGFSAGAAFLVLALLLLITDHRWLWVLALVAQAWVFLVYFAVSGTREPPFEVWGILLRLLHVPLMLVLAYLAWRAPTRRAATA